MHSRIAQSLALLAVMGTIAGLSGCGPVEVDTTVKRVGDRLTKRDVTALLAVVESLPGRKLPVFSGIIPAPPRWSSGRTLPVRELFHEEQRLLAERLSVSAVTTELSSPKNLHRVLRREDLTFEQFAGLIVAVGAALNRTAVTDEQLLHEIVKKGKTPLQMLEADVRVFSDLSDEHEFVVLDQASWVPAVARAQWLQQVPPENVALVAKYQERLRETFPAEFFQDPFQHFSRILNDEGTPFEERPDTGTDAVINWDPAEEVRGAPSSTARRSDARPQ